LEIFNSILSIIKTIQLRDIVDILAIALLIFGLFKLIQETRAVQLLKGVIMLLIVYFLSSLFGLVMLSSLLRTFFEAAVVVIAIIFQPEIRKALEQMGRNNTYKKYIKIFTKHHKGDEWKKAVEKSIVDAADTAVLFSRSKTGALLVFERETMRVAASLMDFGCNTAYINKAMFETKSKNKIQLERAVYDSMTYCADGRCAIIYTTLDMLKKLNTGDDEMEGLASIPRQIEGVLIGITMREKEGGFFKISVRTNNNINASDFCSQFGGGGHPAAAGCSIEGDLETVKTTLEKAAEKFLS
jgi:DNA integrity scanning protein DisA with diadenylate cyclase activity